MTQAPAHQPRTRVIVLGLMRRPDGRVLVERGGDRHNGQVFYRLLGGGVEFGEYAAGALAREFVEELDLRVTVGARRGVFENIFVYEGKAGHEIVFIHDVEPEDAAFLTVEAPERTDGGHSQVCWRSLTDMDAEGAPLYPQGLRDILV